MSARGLGSVKTKSDLVLMLSGGQISAFFFALRITTELKTPGAAIPRRVFTRPGVKTLRGMTAPRILRLVVTFRAKKCRNLSSAQHYDQIRFRFYTAWVKSCREQMQQTESLFEYLVRESEQIIGYVQP
jgi:hypothetical protein